MSFPVSVAPSAIPVPCIVCQQYQKCASCFCDHFICEDCLEKHLNLCGYAQSGRSKHWKEKRHGQKTKVSPMQKEVRSQMEGTRRMFVNVPRSIESGLVDP